MSNDGRIREINWFRLTWQVSITIFVAVGAFLVFMPTGPQHYSSKSACISCVKQVNMAVLMYASDQDDNLPVFYTFDLKAERFSHSIEPYLKNLDMLKCPELNRNDSYQRGVTALEGTRGLMDFVHCSSLTGVIPEYSAGKRLLNLNSFEGNPATTPYLRDPLATKSKKDREEYPIVSPHGPGFTVGFLDGHVKSVKFNAMRGIL